MVTTALPDPLDLSFDIYQRYRLVSDVVESLSTPIGKGGITVLDVGGGNDYLRRFLPHAGVFVLDQAPMERVEGIISGDAGALPFRPASVDFAVCVDVLEHIPEPRRASVLAELRRVAREGVVIAGPFATEGVREAEEVADRFHQAFFGQPNAWLREHRECGLPDLDRLVEALRQAGGSVVALPNGYLPRWSQMILAAFLADMGRGEQDAYRALCAFYNRYVYPLDNREPAYRHVIVASRRPLAISPVPSPDAWPAQTDHWLTHLCSMFLPVHLSLLALRRELGQRDQTIIRLEQSIRDKDEVIRGFERSVKEWENYTAQVIQDKDQYTAQVIRDKDEYTARAILDKDEVIRGFERSVKEWENYTAQVIQDKDEVIRGFERSVKEWENYTAQVIRDKDVVIDSLTRERDELRQALDRYRSLPVFRFLRKFRR